MRNVELKFTFGQKVWWISKASDYTALTKINMEAEHYCILELEITDIVVGKDYKPEYYVHGGEPEKQSNLFETKEEAIQQLIKLL